MFKFGLATFGVISVLSLITAGYQLKETERSGKRYFNTYHGGNHMSLQSAAAETRKDVMKTQPMASSTNGASGNYSPLIAKGFIEGSGTSAVAKT